MQDTKVPKPLWNLSNILVALKLPTNQFLKSQEFISTLLSTERIFSTRKPSPASLPPVLCEIRLPTKGSSAFSSYFVNVQGRRTPFKSPSGSFEWDPRLSCITTEIKYVNRCVLYLENSQVCTLLFCLHWNVRKILLVSFISLHKGLLLFQLGIISKYSLLSPLEKKKKRKKTCQGIWTNFPQWQNKIKLAFACIV